VTEDPPVPPGVDPAIPSPARLYDCYLGGRHNFPADRAAAKRILAIMPEMSDAAWANRGFHQRAASWLAEQGIRQFIDIGSGLPTVGNTHEIVRQVVPGARVLYVDVDPLVARLSAGLLTGNGRTGFVAADLRDPATVLGHPELRALIDLTEPAGLLMTAVMHFVAPAADPWGIVARYVGALAPGSYLVLSHKTADRLPPRAVQVVREEYAGATENIFLRSRAQVERFFTNLQLVPPHTGAQPGICYVGHWGAEDPALADSDGSRMLYCGVGRRP
jgi:S-adenosyl methyltransferase